jgi:DNA-directed RNA polymerase specialized sigma24 family protein
MMLDDLNDEELYAKFSDRLIRLAATIVGPADAEDVMIDGVVAALNSRR